MQHTDALLVGTRNGLLIDRQGTRTQVWPGCAVTCLARGEAGVVVAGLGAHGVGISLDRGTTWREPVPLGPPVVSVAIDPHRPGRLYAGCQPPRVFVSEDQGGSWRLLKDFADLPGTEHWEIPLRDPAKRVVSESAGEGAAIWNLLVDPRRPGRLIAGVEVGGLVISDDGGDAWSIRLVGGTPDPHAICLHPVDPDVALVSTGFSRFTAQRGVFGYGETGGVYRSTDGMLSFTSVWPVDPEPQYTRVMCMDPRPPHAATVGVRSSYVQKSNPRGLRRSQLKQSRDAGRTWVNLGDGPYASYDHEFSAVTAAPSAPNDVIVGTENGQLFHVDAALLEWTPLGTVEGPVTALLTP